MAKQNYLVDPSHLKPFDSSDKTLLRVVIETPKGSRNKFGFNADEHVFELKKVLPAGMSFLYDFGFVPSTKAIKTRLHQSPRQSRSSCCASFLSISFVFVSDKILAGLGVGRAVNHGLADSEYLVDRLHVSVQNYGRETQQNQTNYFYNLAVPHRVSPREAKSWLEYQEHLCA